MTVMGLSVFQVAGAAGVFCGMCI